MNFKPGRLLHTTLIVLCFFLLPCYVNALDSTGKSQKAKAKAKAVKIIQNHVPSQLLVKFAEDVELDDAKGKLKAYGLKHGRQFKKTRTSKKSVLHRWHVVKVPKVVGLKQVMKALRADKQVEAVELNRLVYPQLLPNDPEFYNQWGLNNAGELGGFTSADIDAVAAWDVGQGSREVVVAIIDSGVDLTHPDLVENLWINEGEIPGNGIDDDGNGYIDDIHGYDFIGVSAGELGDADPSDESGHGTKVAGVVAATGNNSIGITGVSWSSRIMSLRFVGLTGSVADSIEAINYAIDNGANIINASYGGYGFSQIEKDAIQAANEAGVLFVAAAGNDSFNNDVTPLYPASLRVDNIISVAATTRKDVRADFSNYGPLSVHIGAPGEWVLSTSIDGNYSYGNGTSFAAPHVAGAAAVLLSHDPGLTTGELKSLLVDRSEQTPAMFLSTLSGGRLNLKSSLSCDFTRHSIFLKYPLESFTAPVGEPVLLSVQVNACGRVAEGYKVEAVLDNGTNIGELFDDGMHGDGLAGDGIFANFWTPVEEGEAVINFIASKPGRPDLITSANGVALPRINYQYEHIDFTWVDTSAGSIHNLGDDENLLVDIGFDFDFYGRSYNVITINANGFASFSSPFSASENLPLPNPQEPNNLIAAFWDDLDPSLAGDVITLMHGEFPNRKFSVVWQGLARHQGQADETVDFAITLHESTGDIVLHYKDVEFGNVSENFGGSATIGLEGPRGMDGLQVSYNQDSLKNLNALRFYQVPASSQTTYRVNIDVSPLVARDGKVVMTSIDGDGINNNHQHIVQFSVDGDAWNDASLLGGASGSLVPGPARITDSQFINSISQSMVYGREISFLFTTTREGEFQPFPDTYTFYLFDGRGNPYPSDDPLGTDALFSIAIDGAQPEPEIFSSPFASVKVKTEGAPVATAGGPYDGFTGIPIAFNGTESFDPEGDELTYSWNFGDGTQGAGSSPTHTYEKPGNYGIRLVVNDGRLNSAPAFSVASVNTWNQPPVADAGPDQELNELTKVVLDGGNSYDTNGDIKSYHWVQVSGAIPVALSGDDSAQATFTAPNIVGIEVFEFELTVTDDGGKSASDLVRVTIQDLNQPPIANAGDDQFVFTGDYVHLDASRSSDAEGSFTVLWEQISGTPVSLQGASSLIASFSAPNIVQSETVSFKLIVTDSEGMSSEDTVEVTVWYAPPPVVDAGAEQAGILGGERVDLSASYTLGDGVTLKHLEWSSATLFFDSGVNSADISFTAPILPFDFTHVATVVVKDSREQTGQDNVSITVISPTADPDNDDIPSQWEIDNGFDPYNPEDAKSDPDNDGISNLQEYLEGTNPLVAAPAPEAINQIDTAPGENTVALIWGDVLSAASYTLYWSNSPINDLSSASAIQNVTSPYLHEALVNGDTYYYRLTAKNNSGESLTSSEVHAVPGVRQWIDGIPMPVDDRYDGPVTIASNLRGEVLQLFSTGDTAGHQLRVKRKDADMGWQPDSVVTSGASPYLDIRAEMDVDGSALAVWRQYDGERYNLWSSYFSSQSGEWGSPQLVEYDDGDSYTAASVTHITQLVMSSNGWAAIGFLQDQAEWFGGSNRGRVTDKAHIAVLDPLTGWQSPRMVEISNRVGDTEDISLSMNTVGDLAVVLLEEIDTDGPDAFGPYQRELVATAYSPGKGWASPTVISGDYSEDVLISNPTVAIDGLANARVAWQFSRKKGKRYKHSVLENRYLSDTGYWSGLRSIPSMKKNRSMIEPNLLMNHAGDALLAWEENGKLVGRHASSNRDWGEAKLISDNVSSAKVQAEINSFGEVMLGWHDSSDGQVAHYKPGDGWRVIKTASNAQLLELNVDMIGNAWALWRLGESTRIDRYAPIDASSASD